MAFPQLISDYFSFLTRHRQNVSLKGYEMVPNFYRNICLFSIMFSVSMLIVPLILKATYNRWYDALDEKKKRELPAYVVSLVHHIVVVPLAWYYVYKDYSAGNADSVDYSVMMKFIGPFCTGFIIADTLCYALPVMWHHGNFEFLIHHILALVLIYPFMYGPGSLTRFYAHVVICETTNLFFNSAWLLRVLGWRDSRAVFLLEVLFAVSFFLIRFVNLTLVFGIVYMSPEAEQFGLSRYVLPPICLMQWYWMVKIVLALVSKTKSRLKDS